jgi:hypothetical protein
VNGPEMTREATTTEYKLVNARALDCGFEDREFRGNIVCHAIGIRDL